MKLDPELDVLMPPMTDLEFRALVESIQENGFWPGFEVQVSAGDRVLLDGRHRRRACEVVGIEAPTIEVDVPPEKRWDYVFGVNYRRRHLTVDQRRDLIRAYISRHPEASNRAVARATGVEHHTVASVRRGEVPHRETSEEASDHRHELWYELVISYPCESGDTRQRGPLEYLAQGERLTWQSGRIYLTSSAPRSMDEAVVLVREIGNSTVREISRHGLKTMERAQRI